LAERIEAPVLAEPTSQLRFWSQRPEGVLTAGDYMMADAVREELGHPDVVVRTGRAPLTWEGRRFSRELPETTRQITIHPDEQRPDPDHAVDWHISAEVDALASDTLAKSEGATHSTEQGWLGGHLRAEARALEVMEDALPSDDAHLDEPSLWPTLMDLLPPGASLFVSNSMPTRTLDMFGLGTAKDVSVHFNRGLNGIDGIESTGAGIALGAQGPGVAVLGDVAFRHDIGGLSTAKRLDADIVYVVIDNGGGGIFDRLPIAEFDDIHERHFATAPDLDIPEASRGLGAVCREPDTWSGFRRAMHVAIDEGGVQVVLVDTDRHRDKSLGESLRHRLVDSMVDALSS
jgi:2-succinyl-5-enolpyruvyl-6-hydroxy-3-cyclohexene-1-carboxylate synthase